MEKDVPMRIAIVAPLAESVPPKLYGGTERVVSWLTEELVRQGHNVTLFASGDSETKAELVPCAPRGLRLGGMRDQLAFHLVMLREVHRRAAEFDIIHFHIDLLQYPLFESMYGKCLTTLHGRLDLPDLISYYATFPKIALVSISRHQRLPIKSSVNWVRNVPHGLPSNLLPFNPSPKEGYLAFLGRIAPEKRPDRAIEIAKRAGIPLRIAAKIDIADRAFFKEEIEPLLDHPLIDFIGEINEAEKCAFLGNARALLFPIDWPEPFGLVMIEAMSTGTPVVAWRCGSVPEIVADDVNGFIVESMDAAVAAALNTKNIPRTQVREYFERHFTVERMAESYLAAYRELVSGTIEMNGAASHTVDFGHGVHILPSELADAASVAAASYKVSKDLPISAD
jgi:glycosyltransferase involved in cell wall biosynthesis